MATWQRIGVAIFFTLAVAVGGILYQQVFVDVLLPIVDMNGPYSQAVGLLEVIVPIVLLVLLAASWLWVIAGAVQDERTVDTRRVRR